MRPCAAVNPFAALALSPALGIFNPAINPNAGLLAFNPATAPSMSLGSTQGPATLPFGKFPFWPICGGRGAKAPHSPYKGADAVSHLPRQDAKEPLPQEVFTAPIVQLAAVCPICALPALSPDAAMAALAPALWAFNPARSAACLRICLAVRRLGYTALGAATPHAMRERRVFI